MIIGVPKEIKNHEYRVGFTPTSVREAVRHGHTVSVQQNAGQGIGSSDADYEAALAKYKLPFVKTQKHYAEFAAKKLKEGNELNSVVTLFNPNGLSPVGSPASIVVPR